MTPEQALETLDGAVAQLNLTRPQHVQLQEAVQTLAKLVDAPKQKSIEKPEEKPKKK